VVTDDATARVLKDLGRRIAEARTDRGLTQEAFAEEVLGVSLKYLQHLEAGRENLTVASLVSLASRIGCSLPDLFAPPRSRVVRLGRPPKPRAEASAPAPDTIPVRAAPRRPPSDS
jgi:transcriptional regulator with XRE-family HTH domain